jgi:hypothetical protein
MDRTWDIKEVMENGKEAEEEFMKDFRASISKSSYMNFIMILIGE